MYYYKTPIGTFYIRPDDQGRYNLYFGDEPLGNYLNPIQAADDVRSNSLPSGKWKSGDLRRPRDLGEWQASM